MTDEKNNDDQPEPEEDQQPEPQPPPRTSGTRWYEYVGGAALAALFVGGIGYMGGRLAWMDADRDASRIKECKIEGLTSVETLDGTVACVDAWHSYGDGEHLRNWKAAIEACTDRGGRAVRGAQHRWEIVCIQTKPRKQWAEAPGP